MTDLRLRSRIASGLARYCSCLDNRSDRFVGLVRAIEKPDKLHFRFGHDDAGRTADTNGKQVALNQAHSVALNSRRLDQPQHFRRSPNYRRCCTPKQISGLEGILPACPGGRHRTLWFRRSKGNTVSATGECAWQNFPNSSNSEASGGA